MDGNVPPTDKGPGDDRPETGAAPWLSGTQWVVGALALSLLGVWIGRRTGHPRWGGVMGMLAGALYLGFEAWKRIRAVQDDDPPSAPPPKN
jgi:hypothetical protein